MKLHEKFNKYEITKDGRVINKKLNREVSQRQSDFGYKVVCLSDNNSKPCHVKVHRLVASKWIPTDSEDLEVNHIDGNKNNNFYLNLEWVTSKENKEHGWKLGLYSHQADKHYLAKLSNEDVHGICKMLQDGCRIKEISKIYNTTKDVVNNIRSGRSWKSVSSQYKFSVQRKSRRSLKKIEAICLDIKIGLTLDELCSKYSEIPRTELRRILNKKIHSTISCKYF